MRTVIGPAGGGRPWKGIAAGLLWLALLLSVILGTHLALAGSARSAPGIPEGTLISHPFSPIIVHPSAVGHDPEDAPVPERLYDDLRRLRERSFEEASASRRAGYADARVAAVDPASLPSTFSKGDRRFWTDPLERRRALQAILSARARGGDQELCHALESVDGIIHRTLEALGFPRGEGISVRVVELGSLNGQYVGKRISIDLRSLEYELAPREPRSSLEMPDRRSPDNVIATWIHESIHGRAASGAGGVPRSECPGYEEGFAQGLTEAIGHRLGISPTASTYGYYVLAWRQLARALGTSEMELYRRFYPEPLGRVQSAFVDVVDEIVREGAGRSLTFDERLALRSRADELFHSRYVLADPRDFDPEALIDLWGDCLIGTSGNDESRNLSTGEEEK